MFKRAAPLSRSRHLSLGLTRSLAFAVSEWILIFLLFIDACFSYLVARFAYYCELERPCLLCSRLDHVLGEEKTGFYWDLMCRNHKLEISSLVLCHAHNKLVDVHGMCENCLFSFATVNKSNAETYRLLVGKMGAGPQIEQTHDPIIEDHNPCSPGAHICSCCNERCILQGQHENLFRATSIGSEAAKSDASSSVRFKSTRKDITTIRDKAPALHKFSHFEKIHIDPFSHVEYQKVETRSITIADDLGLEKLIHQSSMPEVPALNVKANDPHGLEELDWQQVEVKAHNLTTAELISVDEVSPLTCITETPADVSVETRETKSSVTVNGVISKAASDSINATEASLDINPTVTTTGLQNSNHLDLGDAYKLATIGSKGRQLSGKFLEQRSLKDSARVSEDLKLLLSQLSAARGLELSLNDMSPKVSLNSDEIKSSDTSTSIGMQLFQRRISLERNESGLSLDGSAVSELEGESVVDRLKRQVEHDRKLMGVLYKELEEERNASAVATVQAMAMITRLQEEKAALHMEALQCLRMMEEQAEYDGEALQKANDLLAAKEQELQNLETEIGRYRNTLTDVQPLEM